MNTKGMWIAGILILLLSVWIGLRIGINRDWIAGIFLYVVPTVILTSLSIITIRSKADKKAKKEESTIIQEKLDSLKRDLSV